MSLLTSCTWSDHLILGLIFSQETIICNEVATEWDTCQLCAIVWAKPEVSISPHLLCGSLSMNVYPQCASHLMMEGQQCVCIDFCFRLGKTGAEMYKMLQAALHRVLPKSIEDIWMVFPFQKWMPILWRQPPPRQAVHLPHQGDHGTCARNCLRWPTSDY